MLPASEDPLTESPTAYRTPSAETRRFVRSLPAHCVHSWKTSTRGFKLCTLLSTLLFLFLSLSIATQVRHPLPAGTRSVWKLVTPQKSPLNITQQSLPGSRSYDPKYQVRRRALCTAEAPCFVQMIADLDTNSRAGTDAKPLYISKLLTGRFTMDGVDNPAPKFEWIGDGPLDVVGRMAEEGRGMELSELVMFNRSLYAFDDRTGIVFEIMAKTKDAGAVNLRGSHDNQTSLVTLLEAGRTSLQADLAAILDGLEIQPVARTVLTEGDGHSSPKGMKIEWACERNNELYVGSFGKEYTTPDGAEIVSTANLWVAIIQDGKTMHHRREDWTEHFDRLRAATETQFPGYLIHEAVNWSPYYRKWFFLPRRVSNKPYDEKADERRGSNKMVISTETFEEIHVVDVGFPTRNPERGFSSFKFVPGTNDKYIMALRSAEDEASGTQSTYLSVFGVDGKMVTPEEILISDSIKYEGIEIW